MNEQRKVIYYAIIIGIVTGGGCVLYKKIIDNTEILILNEVYNSITNRLFFPLIPATGGLVSGLLVYWFAKEAWGHGVPEVLRAMLLRGGIIKSKVGITDVLASIFTIGSGGSAGRVGPVVQIGATFSSFITSKVRLEKEVIKSLLAAGAAGGIAATFNAPLGGIFFALEIFLKDFSMKQFEPVVACAITASFVSHIFLGDVPAFKIPPYKVASLTEIPNFLVLGIFTAIFSVIYIKTLGTFESIFLSSKIPLYIQPFIGGLLTGIIGLYFPRVLGSNYHPIEEAITNSLPLQLCIILIFAKLIATSFTLGSGGSGGIFAPALFMGAMLGSVAGKISNMLGFTSHPGAYAIIGMASFIGATIHAPFSSIFIIFEMTRNYSLILPLFTATFVSYGLARFIMKDSIYTIRLSREGLNVEELRKKEIFKDIQISQIMSKKLILLNPEMNLYDLKEIVKKYPYIEYAVVNDEGKFIGVIGYKEWKRYFLDGKNLKKVKIKDIMRKRYITVYPDQYIEEIWNKYGVRAFSYLWIVERKNPSKLIGVCTYKNLIEAYYRFLKK